MGQVEKITEALTKKEVQVLVWVQRTFGAIPGATSIARGLSHFGEHSLGWCALGMVGVYLDRSRSRQWWAVIAAAFGSHALSVMIKQIVRRHRPHDPRVKIHVKTPSELSFPSSHASSTTAATVLIARFIGFPVQLLMVPIMLLSRLVLGVHYPSDVITGAILGTVAAESVFSAESMLDTRCKRKSGQK